MTNQRQAGETDEGSRWPRDPWKAAVWESDLKPLERLVALCYADHARNRDTAWVTHDRLSQLTGLSRSAAVVALRGLVDSRWLVVERRAAQHRSTLYRLTIPIGQQSASRTAEESASRTPAESQHSASRHQQSASRHQQSASRTQPSIDHSPTNHQSPCGEPATAEGLGVVVVESLPDPLRGQTQLRPVVQACERLVVEGWTRDELSQATRDKSWNGAQHGGAVMAWLRDLQHPKPRPRRTSTARLCSNGFPIAADNSCCLEHDRAEALA